MRNIFLISICVLTVGLFLCSAIESYAEHITGDCADELNAVESEIRDGIFSGNGPDQQNMLMKLDMAVAKRDLCKFNDAIDKLEAIGDKATALAPKKLDNDSAVAINEAVSEAIVCVGSLVCQ